jgi:hypothetical protein
MLAFMLSSIKTTNLTQSTRVSSNNSGYQGRFISPLLALPTICRVSSISAFRMPAAKSNLAATQGHSVAIFNDFKSHCDAKRVDTKTTVLTLLRNSYEDYHVTEVDAKKISLFDFASTDKAHLTLDSDDEQFHATRNWSAVGEGIEKKMHPGILTDDFRFAR